MVAPEYQASPLPAAAAAVQEAAAVTVRLVVMPILLTEVMLAMAAYMARRLENPVIPSLTHLVHLHMSPTDWVQPVQEARSV